ncbi:MAG: hypothetical protein O7H41_15390 [Planctomycetota bacterium]|nr:hypothetical protein [Planctomycetota bacterium]
MSIALRSYEHFAAAYGTCWLVVLMVALAGQTHIETGLVGLLGFPIVGLVYACIRYAQTNARIEEFQDLRDRISKLELEVQSSRSQGV